MVKAIDIHVHPPNRPGSRMSDVEAKMSDYFKSEKTPTDPEEFYQYYKDRDQLAVLLAFDQRTTEDGDPTDNDWVAELVKRHPDQFIGFGGVDPWMGKLAVTEARRCVEELGFKGFKFHSITQKFEPNDPQFFPLWEEISRLGVPALFHTGQTGVGAGLPGQAGYKNKYAKPYPYFDDLAADFPALQIIMAHPSFPWVDEQLSVATMKTNVWVELSGWSPKYFSQNLIQYCSTVLSNKTLYGSDYPAITPDRWMRDFAAAPFKDEARPKILLENAKRLLKLDV